jgi:hypothetical protein
MPPGKRKKSLKTVEKDFSFLGLRLPVADPAAFRRHILLLACLSILTKLLVIFFTTAVFASFVDYFDISYYLQYAVRVWQGQIPYVTFTFDYPQLAFISILLPFLVALPLNNVQAYFLAHQVLMSLFDLGTIILVYLVALKFYDQTRAFLCGVLAATAFSSAYFVLTKYDAFPTFVLMLSLTLFLYRRETLGYAFAAVGFLVKWFPVVAFPYYLIHDYREGRNLRVLIHRILLGAAIVLAITLPFIILSPSGFLKTYTVNVGYFSQSHSFVYYLDFIGTAVAGTTFFGSIVVPVMGAFQLGLLYLYWRSGSRDLRVLYYFVFFATLVFMIFNPIASPQYIIWVTPFLAIFLARTLPEMALFYAYQLWVYMEFPLLYKVLYTNTNYYPEPSVGGVPMAFFFFTVKFVLLFVMAAVTVRQVRDLPSGKAAAE